MNGGDRILVAVLDAQTTTHREYRLGAVRDGCLDLRGVLIKAPMSVLLRNPHEVPQGHKTTEADKKLDEHISVEWFAEDVHQDPHLYPQEVFFVPLLETDFLLNDANDLPDIMDETKGVVLERTGTDLAVYKRLGCAEMHIDRKWFQNQSQTTFRIV